MTIGVWQERESGIAGGGQISLAIYSNEIAQKYKKIVRNDTPFLLRSVGVLSQTNDFRNDTQAILYL